MVGERVFEEEGVQTNRMIFANKKKQVVEIKNEQKKYIVRGEKCGLKTIRGSFKKKSLECFCFC